MSKAVTNWNTRILAIGASFVTLAINPWNGFDPINLPKFAAIVLIASIMLPTIVLSVWRIKDAVMLFLFALITLHSSYLLLNVFLVANDTSQALWGTWGRNTGALTYVALGIFLLCAATLNMTEISYVLKLFARISYFVSIYTLIQYADLDPISWSQKLPMATLGNINFMSSFLGLATCLFLSKIFCESLNLPEKVHFVFWSLLNLFLIVQSGSIQGIGILFVGLGTLVILKAFTQKNLISGFFVTGLLFLSGIVVLVGTAGRGFLGGALFQQTVTYRLDYWQAGWQMFLWNPWFGLGIDSYGDYYREYRSLEATEKTGPARVANTAHNIFLDLMSGGGFLSGFFLILLFLFPVWLGIKNFQTMRSETQFFLLFPLVIGFLFFCLISINQIGVGVWGFIFIGMCIAVSREVTKINKSTNQSNLKKSNSIGVSSEFQNKKTKVSLACFSFVMALSLVQIPVKADINFLKATKENNIAEMMKIVGSFASNSFYEERVLSYLVESNRIQEAIGLAQKLTSSDSQNFYAWSVLAFESDVPKKLRDEAALQLIRIDPQNRQLRIDLANRGR